MRIYSHVISYSSYYNRNGEMVKLLYRVSNAHVSVDTQTITITGTARYDFIARKLIN